MSRQIRDAADLDRAGAAGQGTLYPQRLKILVGSASCGVAMAPGPSRRPPSAPSKELALDAVVSRTGCIGCCGQEPLLDLLVPGGPRVSYSRMTPEKTRPLLEAYASRGDLRPDLAFGRFEREEHVATGECHRYPDCPGAFRTCRSGPGWISIAASRKSSSAPAARSIPSPWTRRLPAVLTAASPGHGPDEARRGD